MLKCKWCQILGEFQRIRSILKFRNVCEENQEENVKTFNKSEENHKKIRVCKPKVILAFNYSYQLYETIKQNLAYWFSFLSERHENMWKFPSSVYRFFNFPLWNTTAASAAGKAGKYKMLQGGLSVEMKKESWERAREKNFPIFSCHWGLENFYILVFFLRKKICLELSFNSNFGQLGKTSNPFNIKPNSVSENVSMENLVAFPAHFPLSLVFHVVRYVMCLMNFLSYTIQPPEAPHRLSLVFSPFIPLTKEREKSDVEIIFYVCLWMLWKWKA